MQDWGVHRACCQGPIRPPPSLEQEMDREELKAQVDELMRQYDDEEIDGDTYAREMLELTASAQDED